MCLQNVGCKWLDEGAGEKLEIYGDLQRECLMHTTHSRCRRNCNQWRHDGTMPLATDCLGVDEGGCWIKYDMSTRKPPQYDEGAAGCERGSPNFKRYMSEFKDGEIYTAVSVS